MSVAGLVGRVFGALEGALGTAGAVGALAALVALVAAWGRL